MTDSLFVDDSKTSFRNKVKSKFNPQVIKTLVNNKGKEIVKLTFMSPLPPPIPAKSSKEVNEISKYFKKNEKQPQKKSYVQASLYKSNSSTIAMDTLKIKETFPHLQNKKIDQVQKIINRDNSKLKPHLNMTTKGSSQKQVTIPINNEVTKRYLKDVSMHIININHVLKNIKSNIITNFICVDDKEIITTTNNVASPSNLQEIEKCVKNLLTNDVEQISSPRLP